MRRVLAVGMIGVLAATAVAMHGRSADPVDTKVAPSAPTVAKAHPGDTVLVLNDSAFERAIVACLDSVAAESAPAIAAPLVDHASYRGWRNRAERSTTAIHRQRYRLPSLRRSPERSERSPRITV